MLQNVSFERKFSRNFYKDLKLPLSEMKFGHLPLSTERGDIYPVIESHGIFDEKCSENIYTFLPKGEAHIERLIGRFNPYSTYEIIPERLSNGARIGIAVAFSQKLSVYAKANGEVAEVYYSLGEKEEKLGSFPLEKGVRFLFTFHGGIYLEAYCKKNGVITHVGDAVIEECRPLIMEEVFSSATAALYLSSEDEISVAAVLNYLDSGIMQADIRPVKYENGEVLVENGKIYLTYTSRFEKESMQQIASYQLSTSALTLEGALLFDSGNGAWCSDVASTLVYDRAASLWRLWLCVFSNGHRLAYAESANDPRFGISVVDVKPLPFVEDHRDFGGRKGDEDPDLIYNEKEGAWYLSVCRSAPETGKYRYYLFKSERADSGFAFVSRTEESEEVTGGSFVRWNGETYFTFGRSFGERSKYDVCAFPTLKKLGELSANYADGGFRGWGSVFEIPVGTRKRLLWVTFDRTLGSSYNWSYGNLYFYESPTYKK